MSGLDDLKAALPEYAKDLKLNLGSVIGTSTLPAPSNARRMAPTWPSIIPDGATMCAPASAWASATSA